MRFFFCCFLKEENHSWLCCLGKQRWSLIIIIIINPPVTLPHDEGSRGKHYYETLIGFSWTSVKRGYLSEDGGNWTSVLFMPVCWMENSYFVSRGIKVWFPLLRCYGLHVIFLHFRGCVSVSESRGALDWRELLQLTHLQLISSSAPARKG